jgi:hypothetical protein
MLQFIAQYPLAYYIKTLTNPKKRACRIGLYISRDSTMMLLKKKGEAIFWNGRLREISGAPSLENTVGRGEDKIVGVELPTNYRKEVTLPLGLNKFNEVTIILEDPDAYTSPYTVTNYETAAQLEEVLMKDPGSIITAWKNYSQNSEYIWEILSPRMEILRGAAKLPKKVLLCGFPEERAFYTARWLEQSRNELVNLIPVIPAALTWAVANGPEEGFFFLVQTPNEIAISYIEQKEIKMLSTQKTKEGFTSDEIADVNELVLEIGKDTSIPIWCWGILPGTTAYSKLSSRYPLLKSLIGSELSKLKGIAIKTNEEKIDEKEAWLLDAIMG